MTVTLTWRPNRAGDLWAAYLGACRVGYATAAGLWHLTLVRPSGGGYMGRAASQEAARAEAAAAAGEWVAAAGLSSSTSLPDEGTVSVPSVRKKRLL